MTDTDTALEQRYADYEPRTDRFVGRLYRFHGDDIASRAVILKEPNIIPLPVRAVPEAFAGKPLIKDVIEAVADYYRMTVSNMERHYNGKAEVKARMVAYYIASEMTGKPLTQIGRLIGGRDHSTILRGIERIKLYLQTDARLADDIEVIKLHIRERLLNRGAA